MSTARWIAQSVCTIDDFLSASECAALIGRSEANSYEMATVSTRAGAVEMPDLRNNDRVILDDPDYADILWQRLKDMIPPTFHNVWRASGLNERLRFYRYDVGQQFDWHCDGKFWRSQQEESHFTFMIYLNQDFEGGETAFRALPEFPMEDLVVEPKTGMALIFHHPVYHQGAPVLSGRKYVLRSDVMYRLDD
ncbi:MAG: 2OG-Fe(II) oxygenase [Sphingomonas sp.]